MTWRKSSQRLYTHASKPWRFMHNHPHHLWRILLALCLPPQGLHTQHTQHTKHIIHPSHTQNDISQPFSVNIVFLPHPSERKLVYTIIICVRLSVLHIINFRLVNMHEQTNMTHDMDDDDVSVPARFIDESHKQRLTVLFALLSDAILEYHYYDN